MITSGPEDAIVCKRGETIFDCGYISDSALSWYINGTTNLLNRRTIEDRQSGFPLEWLVNGNDTNTTRLRVGPVDDSLCGNTTFQCEIQSGSPVLSRVATLAVIG